MTFRNKRKNLIYDDLYINTYNGYVQVEYYDSYIGDFRVLETFKTFKDFFRKYEEYQYY